MIKHLLLLSLLCLSVTVQAQRSPIKDRLNIGWSTASALEAKQQNPLTQTSLNSQLSLSYIKTVKPNLGLYLGFNYMNNSGYDGLQEFPELETEIHSKTFEGTIGLQIQNSFKEQGFFNRNEIGVIPFIGLSSRNTDFINFNNQKFNSQAYTQNESTPTWSYGLQLFYNFRLRDRVSLGLNPWFKATKELNNTLGGTVVNYAGIMFSLSYNLSLSGAQNLFY